MHKCTSTDKHEYQIIILDTKLQKNDPTVNFVSTESFPLLMYEVKLNRDHLDNNRQQTVLCPKCSTGPPSHDTHIETCFIIKSSFPIRTKLFLPQQVEGFILQYKGNMSDLSKSVPSKDLDERLKSFKNASLKKEALMGLYQGVEKQVGQGLGLDAAAGKDAILCLLSGLLGCRQ